MRLMKQALSLLIIFLRYHSKSCKPVDGKMLLNVENPRGGITSVLPLMVVCECTTLWKGQLPCWRNGLSCQTCLPWKHTPGWCGGSEWSRREIGRLKRRNDWPSDCRMLGQVKEEQFVPGRTVRLVRMCPNRSNRAYGGKNLPFTMCSLSRRWKAQSLWPVTRCTTRRHPWTLLHCNALLVQSYCRFSGWKRFGPSVLQVERPGK